MKIITADMASKLKEITKAKLEIAFKDLNMDDESIVTSGLFERIGIDGSNYTIKYNGEEIKEELITDSHVEAAKILLDKCLTIIVPPDYISNFHNTRKTKKSLYNANVFRCIFHQQPIIPTLSKFAVF